jgi:hypothetical protein
MRGNQVIDPGQSCHLDGRHDALGIPDRACAGISRIDEHRFARRRHEQCGVSALHIDDIDIQRLGCPRLRGCGHHGHRNGQHERKR